MKFSGTVGCTPERSDQILAGVEKTNGFLN